MGLRAVEASQDLGQALGAASKLRALVSAALEGAQRVARGLRALPPSESGEEIGHGKLGLGLYIAKQIVSSGRGAVVAYSTDGQTTFSMRLPRHPPSPASWKTQGSSGGR